MAHWTRFVLRFRWLIVGFWLVVLLAGGFAASKLTPLLSNTFTVPGTDSERARAILQEHFGDRSDGEFLVVFRITEGGGTAGVSLQLEQSIRRAATACPRGRPRRSAVRREACCTGAS
jgi:RND superfamily putative drug exporter